MTQSTVVRRINVVASAAPWVPAPGNVGVVPMVNRFLDVDPCPLDDCTYNQLYNSKGNEHVITAESGGISVPDYGVLGGVFVHGGGHFDYGGNEVYVLDIDALLWKRLSNPTDDPSLVSAPTIADTTWGEYVDGQPGSSHTYDGFIVLDSDHGGSSAGTVMRVVASALGIESTNSGGAHIYDLTQSVPGTWARYGTNTAIASNVGATVLCCHDTTRNVVYQTQHSGLGGSNRLNKLDLNTATWNTSFVTMSSFGTCTTQSAMMFYHPTTDRIIFIGKRGASSPDPWVVYYASAANPSGTGWTQATLSGDTIADSFRQIAADLCGADGKIYMGVPGDTSALYSITVPTIATDNWVVTRIPLAGTVEDVLAWTAALTRVGVNNDASFKRFAWCEKVGCYVWPFTAREHVSFGSDIPWQEHVLCFKPAGT